MMLSPIHLAITIVFFSYNFSSNIDARWELQRKYCSRKPLNPCSHLPRCTGEAELKWGNNGTGTCGSVVIVRGNKNYFKQAGGSCKICCPPTHSLLTWTIKLPDNTSLKCRESTGSKKRGAGPVDSDWQRWPIPKPVPSICNQHQQSPRPFSQISLPTYNRLVTKHKANRYRPKSGSSTSHKSHGRRYGDKVFTPCEKACKPASTKQTISTLRVCSKKKNHPCRTILL